MPPSQSSPVPTLTTQPSIYSPQPVYHPNVRSPSLHSQTLSDYGSNNKSPSLLGPPLTRDHSAATSNSTAAYLPTPTDEAMNPPAAPLARNETTLTTYYRNQAFPERLGSGGQFGKGQTGDGTRGRPRTATSQGEPSTRAQTDAQAGPTVKRHVIPLGQRLVAGPRSSPVTAPRMTRQRSARELISQYNEFDSLAQAPVVSTVSSSSETAPGQRTRSVSSVSLSPRRNALLPPVPTSGGLGISPDPTATNPPRVPPSHCLPENTSYFSTFARSRGKMRDSFTNLIQLLGDKAKTRDKDGGSKAKSNLKKRNSVSPSASFRAFSNALPRGFKLNLGKQTSLGPSPSGSPGKDKGGENTSTILPDMNELLKSEPEMSALLLYQSPARQRHSHSNHTRWMPYSVSMYPTSIILQIPKPGLSSTNKFQIPLSDLYDTHSVPSKELPPEIIPAPGSLPPGIGFGEEIYVFEMYCYGGRIERFAAPNMATRAKWVAYLLDALVTKNAQAGKDGMATPSKEHIAASTSPTLASPTKSLSISSAGERAKLDGDSKGAPEDGSLANFAPSPSSLTRSAAVTTSSVESMSSPNLINTSGQIPVPAPEPLLSTTRILGRGRNARSASTNPRSTSVLPNPWDPSSTITSPASTTTPRPTSPATQRTPPVLTTPRTSSLLMSPRSDRSGMTASPSICRLDERNLVRNRLAMFERQVSPSPTMSQGGRSTGGGSLRGVGGTMNWEVLNEVRSGRRSSLLRSGMKAPIPVGPRAAMSPGPGPRTVMSHRPRGGVLSPDPTGAATSGADSGSVFRPRWPFPEPSIPTSGPGPNGLMPGVNATTCGSNNSTPGPINPLYGPNVPTPGPVILAPRIDGLLPALERQANSGSLLARLTSRSPVAPPPVAAPESIQVLGNLPPSKKSAPRLVEDTASGPLFGLVSERLASLSAALRESDVAHSTKASGLGQLVASTQDHIVHAIEESTKVSSQEHATTTRHLERLQGTFKELADRPTGPSAEERAELLAIKEAIERIDRAVSSRLENLSGEGERSEREELKGIVVQRIEGLKQTVQDLASKMEDTSTQSDVLAKLNVIFGAISSNASPAPTLDSGLLEGFVQQIKDHISSLPTPSLDSPSADTSELLLKLDSIAAAVTNTTPQVGILDIQRTLEEIRELAQGRQLGEASLNSSAPQTDLSDVLMKLDGVAAMCQSFMESKSGSQAENEDTENSKQEAQDQLLAALREDADHRKVQVQQMSELVRYSNELNAWLEKFVVNASTQMDSVGTGLGSLRRDLGLDPPLPVEGPMDAAPPPSALQELRGMFAEQIKATGEITASLNALLAAFNEEQTRTGQDRQSLATDAVLKMIDVQRQEQERLLKQLATDLSSDIRGERIRFVEAMSQATSMNVQLHVEEFKKQLTHEVLALTDEVGRLREERKTIQHQIAQLFLVKSEHEAEMRASESLPPRPVSTTRPVTN